MDSTQRIVAIGRGVRLFLRSSWLSILFIVVIFILAAQIDQGTNLVIHLLDHNPVNLLLFLLILNSFSIVVSHYPTYIQTWNVSNHRLEEGYEDGLKWYLTKYRFLGFGIITYRFTKKASYAENISVSLRRLLGVVLHFTIIYILLVAYGKYVSHITGTWWTVFTIIALLTMIVYLVAERKIKELKPPQLTKLMFWANWFFFINLIVSAALLVVSALYGWSPATFGFFLLDELLSVIGFTLFRNIRLHLDQKKVKTFPLSIFSNHQDYLLTISIVGWLSFLIVLVANIKVFWISPITLIMAYLYLIYGMIIIPIKHFFYYSSTKDTVSPITRRIVLWVTPFLLILFIGFTYVSGVIGNGLHLVPEQSYVENEVLTENDFVKKWEGKLSSNPQQFYIASYGGGLKANAWTMMVLEQLTHFQNEENESINILDQTVAMSGVSGGSLGQAFYTALYNPIPKAVTEINQKIEEISEENFLSMDVAYTLGWDFMRELLIGKKEFQSPDRSGLAMEKYSQIIGDPSLTALTFQSYWKNKYDQLGYCPVLISNSTGIHLKRGIACSLGLKNFANVFPSATNILDLEEDRDGQLKSLTYLGAVSCTNRFPVLSPTARVRGKGNFLDGGYFENSGMLSLLDFHGYLRDHYDTFANTSEARPMKKVFIQVINSQSEYLLMLLQGHLEALHLGEDETGEINAIMDVVTSIELLPRYVESHFQRDEALDYVQIHLPYRISMADVERMIGGKLSGTDKTVVQKIIDDNNQHIEGVVFQKHSHWDAIEPPLARLIGEESVNYMRAIIEEGSIFKDLRECL